MKWINLLLLLLVSNAMPAQDSITKEAESADKIVAPFNIKTAATAKEKKAVSEGKYIEVPQGKGSGSQKGGEAHYSFLLPEKASYYFWARVWWLDSCGNSCSIKIGKYPPLVLGNDNTFKRWQWVRAKAPFKLAKGAVKVIIVNREDGVKIDQILMTLDEKFVPTGFE